MPTNTKFKRVAFSTILLERIKEEDLPYVKARLEEQNEQPFSIAQTVEWCIAEARRRFEAGEL